MHTRRLISGWGRRVFLLAGALAGLCPAGRTSAAEPLVFEVAAGDFDRQDVAVAAEVPASLRHQTAFTLVRLDTGEPAPVQIEHGAAPRVWWVVAGSFRPVRHDAIASPPPTPSRPTTAASA